MNIYKGDTKTGHYFANTKHLMDNIILTQRLAFNFFKMEVRIFIYDENKENETDTTWSLLLHKDATWQTLKEAVVGKLLLLKA